MIKFKAIFLESAKEFLDSLDEIWEFRTKYSGKEIRLLAFWDKDESTNTLVIATHGFLKKYNFCL